MSRKEKEWYEEELEGVELGDKRLNWRLQDVAGKLAGKPEAGINQASEDWADTKAAYRLFKNKKVSAAKILKPHQKRTQARMAREKRVLAVQDTSYLNYSHHPSKKGAGPIGSNKLRGYVMHETLALNEAGLPLGVLTQTIWARSEEEAELSEWEKKNRPIEAKESNKWLAAFAQCSQLRPSGGKLVTVCDREADIYELFVAAQAELATSLKDGGSHHLLVRATQDRSLSHDPLAQKLRAKVRAQQSAGQLQVHLPARQQEPARSAVVTVRYKTVTLQAPYRSLKMSPTPLPPVTLTAILVLEENPPSGLKALQWLLLTNFPVHTLTGALTCIGWYRSRWHIEVYFKVLKSGCTVEDCRLETNERLFPYLALMAIIAWRLYWLTLINRHHPDAPCTLILANHEWQALYATIHRTTSLPHQLPSVAQVVRWLARLGGFLDRNGDGQPGVTSIWRGWSRLQDIAETWLLFHPL